VFLDSVTPLHFWQRLRGMTQAELTETAAIGQGDVAEFAAATARATRHSSRSLQRL